MLLTASMLAYRDVIKLVAQRSSTRHVLPACPKHRSDLVEQAAYLPLRNSQGLSDYIDHQQCIVRPGCYFSVGSFCSILKRLQMAS